MELSVAPALLSLVRDRMDTQGHWKRLRSEGSCHPLRAHRRRQEHEEVREDFLQSPGRERSLQCVGFRLQASRTGTE